MGSELPGSWLTVLFCVTGIFVALQLARAEWRRFQTPRTEEKIFASAPRFLRRLAGSILLGLLMALLLFGTIILDFTRLPVLLFAYWGVFAALLLILFAIGAADWLDTKRLLHLQRSEILKRLARQDQGAADPSGPPQAAAPPEGR